MEENNIGVVDLERMLAFAKKHAIEGECSPVVMRFVPNDICSVIQMSELTAAGEPIKWEDIEPNYDCW